jgi:hypothetical protein
MQFLASLVKSVPMRLLHTTGGCHFAREFACILKLASKWNGTNYSYIFTEKAETCNENTSVCAFRKIKVTEHKRQASTLFKMQGITGLTLFRMLEM